MALAAGACRRGDATLAAARLHRLLGAAPLPGAEFGALASTIVQASGSPGWVGLSSDGSLTLFGKRVTLLLDGSRLKLPSRSASDGIRRIVLPLGWQRANIVTASSASVPLIGSPIDIKALLHIEGCVTRDGDGLEGWVTHPNDPDSPVKLGLFRDGDSDAFMTIVAEEEIALPEGNALPVRRFSIDSASLLRASAHSAEACILRGPNGQIVPGGIILPRRPRRSAGSASRGAVRRQATAPLAIVLPLAGELADMAGFLESLAGTSETTRPLVFAVAAGEIRSDLAAMVHDAGVTLLPGPVRSVPAALDAGLRHVLACAEPRDVLVLDAPCPLPPELLAGLTAALRAAPDIGIAQPVTGHAHAAGRAGLLQPVDAVVSHCVAISHACLAGMHDTGAPLLRHDRFVTGAAALTEFSLRAAHESWRSVLAGDAHLPPAPLLESDLVEAALATRDAATLTLLHPNAARALARAADTNAALHRQLAISAWKKGPHRPSVILVTHADGGGVERVVRERAKSLQAEGKRAIVIRPATSAGGQQAWSASDDAVFAHSILLFRAPDELELLEDLLRACRPVLVELHHAASHTADIAGLARRLGVPYDFFGHDYAEICPRVTLVGGAGRYCGEPSDVTECDDCIADHGARIGAGSGAETGMRESVAALRARSGLMLQGARRVVVPSADGARRLRRYFPSLSPIVSPWQDDRELAKDVPRSPFRAAGRTNRDPITVCIAGALGQDKGYEVILACARDAARRKLDVVFTLVGHTIDDARLLDTGRVFITGRYQEEEAVALIRAQRADLGFLPSVWPETWCYALSALWQAGLWTLAFALGAPAERIAATGAGRTVPLGMPAARLNDYMLGLVPASGAASRRLAASHG